MHDLSALVVSRRTLLQWASAGAAVVMTTQPSAPSSTSGPSFSGARFPAAMTQVYDANWTKQIAASFPVNLRIRNNRAGGLVVFEWDPRLFAGPETVLGIAGNVVQPLTVAAQSDHAMEALLPAGVTSLVVHAKAQRLYPNENLSDVTPSLARLLTPERAISDERVFKVSETACNPWSVESSVDWVSLSGAVAPARVVLSSAGPGPVPTGTAFVLTAPDVLDDAVVLDRHQNASTAVTAQRKKPKAQQAEYVLTIAEPIPAGEWVQVILTNKSSDSAPASNPSAVPRLVMNRKVDPGLRESGRWDAFPLTTSGTNLSSYEAAPTA